MMIRCCDQAGPLPDLRCGLERGHQGPHAGSLGGAHGPGPSASWPRTVAGDAGELHARLVDLGRAMRSDALAAVRRLTRALRR